MVSFSRVAARPAAKRNSEESTALAPSTRAESGAVDARGVRAEGRSSREEKTATQPDRQVWGAIGPAAIRHAPGIELSSWRRGEAHLGLRPSSRMG